MSNFVSFSDSANFFIFTMNDEDRVYIESSLEALEDFFGKHVGVQFTATSDIDFPEDIGFEHNAREMIERAYSNINCVEGVPLFGSEMQVYQIVLTDEMVNEINSTKDGEKMPGYYTAYLDSKLGKVATARGMNLYTHVADVQAAKDDLEDAFAIMNRWTDEDEAKVTRHTSLHSMSVGDIVVKADGTKWLVASKGFTPLPELTV